MSKIMTADEFVNKIKDIESEYKTIYVLGCFGAPMTQSNIQRYIKQYSYNNRTSVRAATSNMFGFDCVNLIKGVLWGWNGNPNMNYGGATYCANGVPDIGADTMITYCSDISTDFSKIEVGEAVWLSGHIGIYIGNGLAIECTPKWENRVQVTACNRSVNGYNRRDWTKHGKLPWIDYAVKKKTIEEIAKEVYEGKWGNDPERSRRLIEAGYDRDAVQAKVNELYYNEKKILKGDINGDGQVTAEDARLALRASVGLEDLNADQKKTADVDGDGKITAADSRLILRKAAGIDE